MPTSATAVLIALVALFPGLIGNTVYRRLLGVDWREKEWQSILRLLGFSVFGVVIYAIAGAGLGLLPPAHLFPEAYKNLKPSWVDLRVVIFPYVGHVLGGLVAGVLGAWGMKLLAKISSSTAYPSAWDDFVRSYTPKHWVVVSFTNGDVYAGKVKNADVAVSSDDRDLVLEEPCIFDEKTSNYRAVNYQYLFVRADKVFSIAAIHNADDKRILPVGETLFPKEN
jgi:hypothetical protein